MWWNRKAAEADPGPQSPKCVGVVALAKDIKAERERNSDAEAKRYAAIKERKNALFVEAFELANAFASEDIYVELTDNDAAIGQRSVERNAVIKKRLGEHWVRIARFTTAFVDGKEMGQVEAGLIIFDDDSPGEESICKTEICRNALQLTRAFAKVMSYHV